MKRHLLLATASVAVFIATSAAAQDGPATEIEEIIVTGTREQGYRATVAPQVNKSDTPLQEVPFSVQVVTRELITDRGVTTLGEALRYTPGLSPQVGYSNTNDVFRIRGFATNFIYKNGFRRSTYTNDNQLQNIEQIEVLKGPASALYGRAEPSGVVNIVTKRPLDEGFTDLGFQFGDFEAYRATLDFNTPVTDTLGFRLNASYDDRGSYRDLGRSETSFISPVLVWQATPATRVTLEGEYSELESFPDRGFGNSPLFLTAPRERQFSGTDANLERDGGLLSLIVEHDFSTDVSGRLAWQQSELTINALIYNAAFPPVSGATGPNPLVNVRPNITFDEQKNTTFQAELYARFDTGPFSHKALIGFEDSRDRWDFVFLQGPLVSLDFNNPVGPTQAQGPFTLNFGGLEKAGAQALYVQDEISSGPIRLTLGARYDRSEASVRSEGFGPPAQREKDEDQVSPRVGLTWTPVLSVSLYASWAESFTPQLIRVRSGVSEAVRGDAAEVGIKASLFGGRVNPTLALFEVTRFNAAVSDPSDPGFSILVGESRSRGIEIEVPAAITPQWRLIANYTHLDAEVVNDAFLTPGTKLLNAPEEAASLWTSYDFTGPLEGLTIGAGVLHIGDRAGNTANTITLPAYTRVDANVAYTFDTSAGPVRAQVNALNLTDEFYYDSGGAFLPLFPGAPRAITASLSVRF